MKRLTSEQEEYLTRLIEIETNGGSVEEFIEQRLYTELSKMSEKDAIGTRELIKFDGFDREYDLLSSLAEAKMLKAARYSYTPRLTFFDLTTEGRCYFVDTKKQEEADIAQVKDQWRHDLKMTLIGAVAGAVLGFIAGVLGSWMSSVLGWF